MCKGFRRAVVLCLLFLTSSALAFLRPVQPIHHDRLASQGRLEIHHRRRPAHKVQMLGNLNFDFLEKAAWKLTDKWKFDMRHAALGVASAFFYVSAMTSSPPPVQAADTIKIGACLLKNCQYELFRCIIDPKCLANVICLNTCNTAKDEVGCQIGCGDLFENEIVGKFNACALSKKQCVPQKPDNGQYPPAPDDALVKTFDINEFDGRWYISAGLNPLFDVFDCQVHFFNVQPSGALYAKINWRVTEPDGEFFKKNTLQRFIQDPEKPGILYNHDNEYLHYQDDWYILDYVPDEYILVYYRGQNDAWVGYGGAVVYSREPKVPEKYRKRISDAFAKAGVNFKKFKEVDNTCKELEKTPTALRAEYAKKLFLTEEQEIQESLTAVRGLAQNAVREREEEAQAAIKDLEEKVRKFEGIAETNALGLVDSVEQEALEVVRGVKAEVQQVEKAVEKVFSNDAWKASNQKKLDSLSEKLKSPTR